LAKATDASRTIAYGSRISHPILTQRFNRLGKPHRCGRLPITTLRREARGATSGLFFRPNEAGGPWARAPLKPTLALTADGEEIAPAALPAAELVGFGWEAKKRNARKKEPAATISVAAGFFCGV
jgi:hypothetical protein